MSSASGGSFNSSLPIWIILFYFFFSDCCGYEFSYCIKWAVRVGIFSLILNLAGRLSIFQFWVLYWLCFYNKWLVLCWDMFLLHSVWWVFFMNGCWIISNTILCLLELLCDLCCVSNPTNTLLGNSFTEWRWMSCHGFR